MLTAFSSISVAEDFYWLDHHNNSFTQDPMSYCIAYAKANYDRTEGALIVHPQTGLRNGGTQFLCSPCTRKYEYCYNVNFYFNRQGDECSTSDYNEELGICEPPPDCSTYKPLTSQLNLSQGCYNSCQFENLGAIRDYDNLLAPIQYEYLSTGLTCTSLDQELTGSTEYTETSEEGHDCRTTDQYQVCINAETSCKIIDGIESCVDNETREQDYNCGTFNGEVVCIKKSVQSSCTFVNGERLCVYPEGEAIDIASVDHPDNGGNGDGNNNNDILDEQDLSDNSLTAQQVKAIVEEAVAKQQAQKQADRDNPKSAVSGIECDRTLNCTGDPVQCAIAQYEKRQACLSEYKESTIQQMIDANPNTKPLGAFESDTTVVDVENMLSDEGRFTEMNSCPEPLSFGVLEKSFSISLDPMCELAGYIRYFILFATWFSIAVIIAKSF
ncbi:hypothetical protein EOPP23_06790 [Endozoicomonas sp. OPT23]|nr:hypothetical protein [Endozoicomonas sp. OPT23]